jgi:release factor glutamine methyltransferase
MRSLDAGTIAGALEECRRRLIGLSETPWLDARMLLGHVTGLDASAIVAYGEHRLPAVRRTRLLELLARRASGEPVAYLIGAKEFCGLRFAVDRRVLVPRAETEELVLAVVDDWRGKPAQILELGTGSGAIACSLAHLLPLAAVTATDSSADALAVAEANVRELALAERVSVRQSDLFESIPPELTYDAIVANLPYVRESDADLHPHVREHEPAEALFGGADGLAIYRRMFAQAPARVRSGGKIYCECGPATAAALSAIAQAAFPDRAVEVRMDAGGRERMVIVA